MPSVGYAIISSCITFWIPGITMSLIYLRVFIEASKQEKAISSERKRLQVSEGQKEVDRNVTGKKDLDKG